MRDHLIHQGDIVSQQLPLYRISAELPACMGTRCLPDRALRKDPSFLASVHRFPYLRKTIDIISNPRLTLGIGFDRPRGYRQTKRSDTSSR